jgi:hypothetical protein
MAAIGNSLTDNLRRIMAGEIGNGYFVLEQQHHLDAGSSAVWLNEQVKSRGLWEDLIFKPWIL